MQRVAQEVWHDIVNVPVGDRSQKPRTHGLTMVIDKGLGPAATRDLLETCAGAIDFVKLAFGTSVLYPAHVLKLKVDAIRAHGVDVYPGGTLLELAGFQGDPEPFFARALDLGFTYVEVSEGTVSLSRERRCALIQTARRAGLGVISEVGKKDRSVRLEVEDVARQVEADLEHGAQAVIIEGRDSGLGVGVYEEDGSPRHALIDAILSRVPAPDRLMWEAPLTAQQQYWIRRIGANVNLGNVQPADVMSLEATRVALRGDTLKDYVTRERISPNGVVSSR